MDYEVSSDFTDPENKTIKFNFCKLTEGCGSYNTFASIEKEGKCFELTDGNQHDYDTEAVSSPTGADGIRIKRESATACPEDDSKMLGFVVDVFCNDSVQQNPPLKLVTPGGDADDLEDPCVYHVQLEHEAGCMQVSFVWGRRAIGALFMGAGFILSHMRVKSMKWFMQILVQLTVFGLLLGFFHAMGYLAVADPTAPPREKSVPLGVIAVVVALVAAFIARYFFKKFIKFGPTVIGALAGEAISLYTVLIINGFFGIFQARNAAS